MSFGVESTAFFDKHMRSGKMTTEQVIPTPSHVLGRISPILSPFSPRFLRVFTASTRRF